MKIWEIIEAIDDPSGLIHPERHQALSRGEHPLARHPAYPQHHAEPGDSSANYEEVLATKQWRKILEKANRYLNVPLTQQALPLIQQKTIAALKLIEQAESRYKDELEALAIELVFSLPEFKTAKRAYEEERIVIDADLRPDIDTSEMMTSDEPEAQAPISQQRTPAEKVWMDKMIQRRHFTNAMIQGSAVSNDFLFELAGGTLDRIHPGLRKAYGTLMIATEIGYWIFPQDAVIKGARAKTHVGSVKVRREGEEPEEEEQNPEQPQEQPQTPRPVITARGRCFPVLIQEIIKGLTELASLSAMAGLPRDPADRQEVLNKTDLTDMESWHMILGPKLWDSFLEAVDAENERELTFHLYSHIQRMDNDEFNSFMKEVLAKSPEGMKMLRELAASIKAELADGGIAESATAIAEWVTEN